VELRGLRLLTEPEEACEAVIFLFLTLFAMAGGCSGVKGNGGDGVRESSDDLVMSLRSLALPSLESSLSSSSILLSSC
jgi:hypothetical protein